MPKFNWEITFGDIIKAMSLVVTLSYSTCTLSYSLEQDRELELREQANQVRNAAAATVAKLERWRDISLSLFDSIQPALVATSERLVDKRSKQTVYGARDYLYKELHLSRSSVQANIRGQDLETSYVYLYGYDGGSIRRLDTLTKLGELEVAMFKDLLGDTQRAVERYLPSSLYSSNDEYFTAELGDALRDAVGNVKESFETQLNDTLDPVVCLLTELVFRSDDELIRENDSTQSSTGNQKGPDVNGPDSASGC